MVAIFGIHDAKQLPRFRPNTFLGQRRLIAADLLDTIESQRSQSLRDAYFERFIDHRGAFKRTYRNRFADFDQRIAKHWRSDPDRAPKPHVLDVAVSDGSTTLDFADVLDKETAGAFTLQATDLDARYLVLREAAGAARRVVVAESGDIVQIVYPPFVFSQQRSAHSKLFPVNALIRPAAEAFANALIAKWRSGDADVKISSIVVANPEFRKRLTDDVRLAFTSWNVLERWTAQTAHIVRAMNILNPGYFSAEQQVSVIEHLFDALNEGGLLAAGSNGDAGSEVDGAIYRKQGRKLAELEKTGAGLRCAAAVATFNAR